MMPEMLTDLGITKVNIGLVNILIDDKHIMFVINLKPTNVGFYSSKVTPESVLMNRINHKVFHIHLADKIEFYPNKIA
ncbi:hypothetical protein BML2496_26940 [Providencia rettgeri]|nr:hypothetical protein BML2496_26940 [Providencia rettgeri]